MEYVYAVTSAQEFTEYQNFANRISSRFREYLYFLAQKYHITEPPKCVVFASAETATQRISNIPLPGYTNEFRTVFCPDKYTWRDIYLRQLDNTENIEVRNYYETRLTENNILQILGHEFVHHSELFIDEAYEKTRWFEEGMCEYISRRYFLSDAEFQEETRINAMLVEQFEQNHGIQKLETFCSETYTGTYASIFYFYWKSFLAVNGIVERFGGDVSAVFREYRQWYINSQNLSLSDYFLRSRISCKIHSNPKITW